MNKKSVMELIKIYRECIFSIILFAFFWLVIHFTKDIQLLVINTTVNARFWPTVIGVAGCLLSLLLFIQNLVQRLARRKGKMEAADAGEDVSIDPLQRYHAPITIGLMLLYVAGLESFGFVAMTLLYLFSEFMLLSKREERNVRKLLLVTILFTAFIYILFRYAFQMMLPVGSIWG